MYCRHDYDHLTCILYEEENYTESWMVPPLDVPCLGKFLPTCQTTVGSDIQFVAFLTQIFLFISVSFGIGNHAQVLLEHGTLIHALKWCWIASLLSFFAIGLGKVAAISFLLAIQGPTFFYKRMFLVFLATFNVSFDCLCETKV